MDIEDDREVSGPFVEYEDATATCARLVHEEVTRYYPAPAVVGDPPLPISRHWTSWEAYRYVPEGHPVPAVPAGDLR